MRRMCTLLAIAIVVSASTATSLAAQSEADPELTGHVVSAKTGEPVAGAWVGLQGWERGTYSWRDGHFRLPDVPAGSTNYSVEALGYVPVLLSLKASDGEHVVALDPDASLQPGLAVLFDRLDDRRNGGRVFDRQALAFSGAFNLGELLATRGVRRVRKYCLDEKSSPGLQNVPPEYFYRVEVFGSAVRVYTEEFLERTAGEDADAIHDIIRLRPTLC